MGLLLIVSVQPRSDQYVLVRGMRMLARIIPRDIVLQADALARSIPSSG